MIGKIIKFVLLGVLVGLSAYSFVLVEIGMGILYLLLGGLVFLLIMRNENIIMAMVQLRRNNLPGAQKALNRIKQPQHLIKSQQAYFHYLQAMANMQTNKLSTSESLLKKALNLGLRMDHDKALAKLNLAGISVSKRRKREATTLLAEAKKLDKHGILDAQIKSVKEQMKRI